MPSERTLIDAMARAIMQDRDPEFGNGCGCSVVNWAEEARSNPHVAQALAQARAALRALHDHGPTQRMLDEVCSDDPGAIMFANDVTVRSVFRAMLAAELGDAQ